MVPQGTLVPFATIVGRRRVPAPCTGRPAFAATVFMRLLARQAEHGRPSAILGVLAVPPAAGVGVATFA